MKIIHIKLILFLLLLNFSCSSDPATTEGEKKIAVETASDKSKLEAYYELPHIKEWYEKRILPPPFDFNMDLSTKTAMELRLLKNEIYARNGYLFEESDLRGHFNQFKWYQPIFEVEDFKVYLDEKEQAFIQKVEALEQQHLKNKYISINENKLVNVDHVVNLMQFENLDKELLQALRTNNFAIAHAKHEQLFYVYDENQYEYIPNFITTDLYLQLMHKFLSGQMQEIEEEKLIGIVSQLLNGMYKKSKQELNNQNSPATIWANTYLAIAYTSISGQKVAVDPSMTATYNEECDKIMKAEGNQSDFLDRPFIDYSMFKPRGNYTKTEQLKKYFRCIKWLNTAPMNIEQDEKLQASLQMAFWIKNDPALLKNYNTFSDAILLLAGEEDNVSLSHLIKILGKTGVTNTSQLSQTSTLDKIRMEISKLDVDKIKPVGSSKKVEAALQQPDVLFSAGRYSFDAEIFTKLIHVLRNPAPKRPFPKGLDVFAAMGDKTAESILLNTYNEKKNWPAYVDSLNKVKKRFSNYKLWNKNIYNKTMETIHSLNQPVSKDAPLFMQTQAWQKKNLNTSLAAFAQLKHDMILYSEQPMAAEAGQGGGPPPPKKISYVEPNIAFWTKALELLEFQRMQLQKLNLLTEHSKQINGQMKELATFLLGISNKEIKKQTVTDKEFERMDWLGGEVERLTFSIMKTDHLPERERQIALVADIYSFNVSYLETAVGLADEIYVIAEINGLPYLTRGACFSYYEFVSDTRLTDEEWQEQLSKGNAPEKPIWMKELYVKSKLLKSKAGYSF